MRPTVLAFVSMFAVAFVVTPALVVAPVFAPIAGARPPRRAADQSTRAADQKLPPLSYVCPMPGDEDVVEDKPGRCRKCGMELQPVRLVSVWTCPGQPGVVTQDKPGRCPVDGRPLIQMTMALTWRCPDSSIESIRPGTCKDGSPKTVSYSLRAHGNHNAQHGGQFFMAPDNWHHLEGAYFAPGTFRLYLYDDFTKPLALTRVRDTKARVILTKEGRELPLVRNGRVLEASVGKLALPAMMQVRIRFQPEAPEHLFDFAFEKYSRDTSTPAPKLTNAAPVAPPVSAVPPASPPQASSLSGPPRPAGSPGPPSAPSEVEPVGIDPALVTVPIPDTVPEMVAQLHARNEQIRTLIDRGQFASVYVPAFQAKDVALALDARRSELPAGRQRLLEPAVSRLVRNAYLLDAFGDLGNKQQIVEAYARFASAVKEIESAFPSQP